MSDNPLAEVRAALEPFAKEANRYDPDEGDDGNVAWYSGGTITYGMLRRARDSLAALSRIEQASGWQSQLIDRKEVELATVTALAFWQSSKRPDLSEEDKVRGALMQYQMTLDAGVVAEDYDGMGIEEDHAVLTCDQIAANIRALKEQP